MAKETSFDCGATDLLCNEETKALCFDDADLLEKGTSFVNGRSDSEPLILFPCLDDDCIGWMVERERELLPRDDYLVRLRSGDLDMSLRREALDWLFKVKINGLFFFFFLLFLSCFD